MAKVTGAVRKVWCFINVCLWQSTEVSLEDRDIFFLSLEGPDICGLQRNKAFPGSEKLGGKAHPRLGRLLFNHVWY